jgi:pyruvate/2-oxoglutarate dehydrogenase complex dihydrolipoamide dehydrogenase (E3) component
LLVVGGGPIGCELGQGFQRLGTQVFICGRNKQFLPKEDKDAAELLKTQLEEDGVQILLDTTPVKFEKVAEAGESCYPTIKVIVKDNSSGEESQLEVEAILLGAGRQPNVENLGLEEAGIDYDTESGIIVNDNLRTTNKNVFAAGDCCSKV